MKQMEKSLFSIYRQSPVKSPDSYSEAKEKVFTGMLSLPAQLLHSLRMDYNNKRTISFKLKNQINLEDLSDMEHFTFERIYNTNDEEVRDKIYCRILGIKKQTCTCYMHWSCT